MELRYFCDSHTNVCQAYGINSPNAKRYHKGIQELVLMHEENLEADIIHCSFPCQAFSWHKQGEPTANDEANIATNMTVGDVLDRVKPRVVTMEQTGGLIGKPRHRKYWDKILQHFTSRGFSIRWKVMKFADYGLAQPRKRLIVIASW